MLQEARWSCGRVRVQELHLFSPVFFLTPPIHPTISWGGCPGLSTHESCWSVGTFSSSMEEQSVARDGPCKGGWSVGRMGNRACYGDV